MFLKNSVSHFNMIFEAPMNGSRGQDGNGGKIGAGHSKSARYQQDGSMFLNFFPRSAKYFIVIFAVHVPAAGPSQSAPHQKNKGKLQLLFSFRTLVQSNFVVLPQSQQVIPVRGKSSASQPRNVASEQNLVS